MGTGPWGTRQLPCGEAIPDLVLGVIRALWGTQGISDNAGGVSKETTPDKAMSAAAALQYQHSQTR